MSTEHTIIGVGRSAEILAWGEDRAMKLYREGSSRAWVQREARVSRLVHEAGLPAPAVFPAETEDGLHEIDGRLGILYERVYGPTMLRDLLARPWMLLTHSKALAALHAQMHSVPGDGLPDARERLERGIEITGDSLSASQQAAAREALARLPSDARVCHGDFHPDNVLLQEGGPIIIDWGPASCGHPLADVAWTYLLYTISGSPVDASLGMRIALAFVRRISLRTYLRTYERLTGASWTAIEPWLGVVAILRLADRIPEEREALLRLIAERFGP